MTCCIDRHRIAVMTPVYLPTRSNRQRVGNAHWSASWCVIRRHWWLSFSVSWADTLPAGHLVCVCVCVCVCFSFLQATAVEQPVSLPLSEGRLVRCACHSLQQTLLPFSISCDQGTCENSLNSTSSREKREKILSSFTYLHVSTNLYFLLFFFVEHKRFYTMNMTKCTIKIPHNLCLLMLNQKDKNNHKNTIKYTVYIPLSEPLCEEEVEEQIKKGRFCA